MTLSEELLWRGFSNQTTLADLGELNKRKFKLYFGVDPSSDSMTIGNLAAAMMVRVFQKHGHETTLLIGGATGMIGDPSEKASERALLAAEQIAKNKKAIAAQYKTIFRGADFRLVDNYEWFKNINYIDFLRDVGKHFSLTPLLQRDYIARRIGTDGSGMSYAEFSYTLIQGYDYYHLNQKYGIDLQVCGSDQWGNSISGVDLIRRKTGREVHIFSAPLVTNKSTGKKFGKTEEGAVWLDETKTSVYKFYQFWLNTDDEGVESYLKIYTELDKPSIEKTMREFEADRKSRIAQRTLAYEVTKLVHGEQRAEAIKRVSETLFGGGDYQSLEKGDFSLLASELPVTTAKPGDDIADSLISSGLAGTKSEAGRFLAQGAVYINGEQAAQGRSWQKADRLANSYAILRRGKNANALVKLA